MEERMKVVEQYVSDTAFKGIRTDENVENLRARVKDLEGLVEALTDIVHIRLSKLEGTTWTSK